MTTQNSAEHRQTLKHIGVRVPATSANLGIGFDCLGLALDLVAQIDFYPASKLEIVGCEPRFQNEHNLVWTSYQTTCKQLNIPEHPWKITIASPIPLAGGLGSSACCIIAGVAAASIELQLIQGVQTPQELCKEELLKLALSIESHPDNLAPALFGGLICSCLKTQTNTEVLCTPLPLHKDLGYVVVVPPYEVRTEDARTVLPDSYSRQDCVWQIGHALIAAQAFATADAQLLRDALNDRLHEPYRSCLIPDFEELKKTACTAGAASYLISGSGASMIAICADKKTSFLVADSLKKARPNWQIINLSAHSTGTDIISELGD